MAYVAWDLDSTDLDNCWVAAGNLTADPVNYAWFYVKANGITIDQMRGSQLTFRPDASGGTYTSQWRIQGLECGRTYYLQYYAEVDSNLYAIGTTKYYRGPDCPEPIPARPSGLSTTNVTNSSARLNWASPTAYEYNYRVFNSGGSVIANGWTTNKYTTVSYLNGGSSYSFDVRACNISGDCSSYSSKHYFDTAPDPLGKPTISFAGSTQDTMSWTWSSVSGVGVKYEYEAWTMIGSYFKTGTTGSTRSLTLTGLSPGTSYTLRVRAYNADGDGPWSNSVTRDTQPLAVPSTPTGLTISSITQTTATASWSATPWATSYNWQIYYGGSLLNSGTTATNSQPFSSMIPGYSYSVRVAACNTSGCSSFSSFVTFTTTGYGRPANWAWEDTISAGSAMVRADGTKSVIIMRASNWNAFCARINLFRIYKLGHGTEYSFTPASTSNSPATMRAQMNEARDAINQMLTTDYIAYISSGDVITAQQFIRLRDRLNSI